MIQRPLKSKLNLGRNKIRCLLADQISNPSPQDLNLSAEFVSLSDDSYGEMRTYLQC